MNLLNHRKRSLLGRMRNDISLRQASEYLSDTYVDFKEQLNDDYPTLTLTWEEAVRNCHSGPEPSEGEVSQARPE